MNILITGVAGTGKTTLCKRLRELGYISFSIEDMPGLFQMIDKRTGKPFSDFDNTDLEKQKNSAWMCDVNKLGELIKMNQQEGPVFYCGIASNLEDFLHFFDKFFC